MNLLLIYFYTVEKTYKTNKQTKIALSAKINWDNFLDKHQIKQKKREEINK